MSKLFFCVCFCGKHICSRYGPELCEPRICILIPTKTFTLCGKILSTLFYSWGWGCNYSHITNCNRIFAKQQLPPSFWKSFPNHLRKGFPSQIQYLSTSTRVNTLAYMFGGIDSYMLFLDYSHFTFLPVPSFQEPLCYSLLYYSMRFHQFILVHKYTRLCQGNGCGMWIGGKKIYGGKNCFALHCLDHGNTKMDQNKSRSTSTLNDQWLSEGRFCHHPALALLHYGHCCIWIMKYLVTKYPLSCDQIKKDRITETSQHR